jgi:hypothetical protein
MYSEQGLEIEYDYLSGRVYVSNASGMRIALTSNRKIGLKEIEAIIEKLDALAEYYKIRED